MSGLRYPKRVELADITIRDGFQHEVSLHEVTQGEWVAAQACDDMGAEGDLLMVTDPSYDILTKRVNATKAYLSKNCPDMKVTLEQVSANDMGTVMQNKVSAFLQRNPNPTDEEIRRGIDGNLCRCTGYVNIVKSVKAAAKKMRGVEVTA